MRHKPPTRVGSSSLSVQAPASGKGKPQLVLIEGAVSVHLYKEVQSQDFYLQIPEAGRGGGCSDPGKGSSVLGQSEQERGHRAPSTCYLRGWDRGR